MNKEFLHMQKLAGIITESEYKAKLNENVDNEFINFLNNNKNEIFDIVGKKYSADADELNNTKQHMEFEPNTDGINTVYSPYNSDPNSDLNYWDFGVFSSLSVSPSPKEFEDQIRYDFDIDDNEEIDFTNEEIPPIESINVGGKTIYYSIVVY
jgi:hypothetical protein